MRNIYDSISKHICFVFQSIYVLKAKAGQMKYLCKKDILLPKYFYKSEK